MKDVDWTHHSLDIYEDAVVDAAVRSGLVARFTQGTTRSALKADYVCDERLLEAMLTALSEHGCISEDDAGELRWTGRVAIADALYRMYELRRWCFLAEYLRPDPCAVPRAWLLAEDQARLAASLQPTVDALATYLKPQPGSSWLDVGGGNGCLANALAKMGARVTVIDLPEVFQGYRTRYEASVELVTGDILTQIPDRIFDGIVLLRFVEALPQHKMATLLNQLANHLQPHTGRLYIIGYLHHFSPATGLFSIQATITDHGHGAYSLEQLSNLAGPAGLRLTRIEREGLRDYTLAEFALQSSRVG